MVGHVYRFRVSNIPRSQQEELYPSIEVLDRLHPPAEYKNHFAIPVSITQEDLETALAGSMVVRVIYLENPHHAFPEREGDEQRSLDVLPSEDPLLVADQIGRPMAILRLGSRVPVTGDVDDGFLFHSPPVEVLHEPFRGPIVHSGDTGQPTFPFLSDPETQCVLPSLRSMPNNALLCQPAAGGVGFWPSDEYLCDGGDQGPHVRVRRDGDLRGLDLEDTVAHYDTLDGRTVVTPSNSVCIYAPRFAAVRKQVLVSEDGLLVAGQWFEQPLPPITEDATSGPSLVDTPLPPLRDVSLVGPLGLHHRTGGIDLKHSLPVVELVRDFQVHEDFQVIRLGVHQNSERALLEEHAEAALVWTDNLAPEVMLDITPPEVDVTVEKVGTEYHIGLEGKPRLRVIKLASTSAALPGEEVIFTLRFDNLGDQTIGNVTIMDNLTTRLEYVPDSAECSLKAEFFQEENQGESLALRWEIRDPINPGDGGIIRFRCRVR
jgi:uncharacterized repeat protein (TIGR01451 family)